MTNPGDPNERLEESEKLSECPECGEPADVRVIGYEFAIDIPSEMDLRICSESPQDHDDGLGGAVYFHFGASSDDPELAANTDLMTRLNMGQGLSTAGFGDVEVLTLDELEVVRTPQRLQLFDLLREDLDTVSQLSSATGRDREDIVDDLDKLGTLGLITMHRSDAGITVSVEKDTIVAEPLWTSEGVKDSKNSSNSDVD